MDENTNTGEEAWLVSGFAAALEGMTQEDLPLGEMQVLLYRNGHLLQSGTFLMEETEWENAEMLLGEEEREWRRWHIATLYEKSNPGDTAKQRKEWRKADGRAWCIRLWRKAPHPGKLVGYPSNAVSETPSWVGHWQPWYATYHFWSGVAKWVVALMAIGAVVVGVWWGQASPCPMS